jgi:hypothetical protein
MFKREPAAQSSARRPSPVYRSASVESSPAAIDHLPCANSHPTPPGRKGAASVERYRSLAPGAEQYSRRATSAADQRVFFPLRTPRVFNARAMSPSEHSPDARRASATLMARTLYFSPLLSSFRIDHLLTGSLRIYLGSLRRRSLESRGRSAFMFRKRTRLGWHVQLKKFANDQVCAGCVHHALPTLG